MTLNAAQRDVLLALDEGPAITSNETRPLFWDRRDGFYKYTVSGPSSTALERKGLVKIRTNRDGERIVSLTRSGRSELNRIKKNEKFLILR